MAPRAPSARNPERGARFAHDRRPTHVRALRQRFTRPTHRTHPTSVFAHACLTQGSRTNGGRALARERSTGQRAAHLGGDDFDRACRVRETELTSMFVVEAFGEP